LSKIKAKYIVTAKVVKRVLLFKSVIGNHNIKKRNYYLLL